MTSAKKAARLGSFLSQIINEKKWAKKLGLYVVFDHWAEAVGDEIAMRTKPSLIRDSVLWVKVTDSVWMQQLQLQKILLLERINRQIPGEEKISDIRFDLDTKAGRKGESGSKPLRKPLPVDPGKAAAFQKVLAGLEDEETKKRLFALWTKSQQFPKEEEEDSPSA